MIALYVVGIMWVGYLIFGIIDAAKNIKARKAYEEEIGHKVSNKEWRAYKKEEAKAKKEATMAKKQVAKFSKIQQNMRVLRRKSLINCILSMLESTY